MFFIRKSALYGKCFFWCVNSLCRMKLSIDIEFALLLNPKWRKSTFLRWLQGRTSR